MGADDGRADAFSVIDDRVALRAQFMHETAYAKLVVGIATLQRADFRVDKRFQFRGTGNGPLDAFVHGRDFAPDGLTDRHDTFGCNRLGFGKPECDFRHRACGVSQILCARHHDREGKEQHDRHNDADDHGQNAGTRYNVRRGAYIPKSAAEEELCEAQTSNGPEDGNDCRVTERRTHRAALKRSHDGRGRTPTTIICRRECGRLWCHRLGAAFEVLLKLARSASGGLLLRC